MTKLRTAQSKRLPPQLQLRRCSLQLQEFVASWICHGCRTMMIHSVSRPGSNFCCVHWLLKPHLFEAVTSGSWAQAMMLMQEPGLRRVHARTQQDIKLDAVRPEYHRATLSWARQVPAFHVPLRSHSCPSFSLHFHLLFNYPCLLAQHLCTCLNGSCELLGAGAAWGHASHLYPPVA